MAFTITASVYGSICETLTWLFSEAGQTFLQNVIAGVAVFLAARGVRNWSLERRDLRRAELAEKSLEAAYRIRDTISAVRSPWSSGEEGSSRKREEGETDELRRLRDIAYVQIERLNKHAAQFEELLSLRYSVSAAFGKEPASLFDPFFTVRKDIINAARMKYRTSGRDGQYVEQARQRDAVIWEGAEAPDKIVDLLNEAIEKLEKRFRPYVEARFQVPRLFRWR
jgi:hypothetical protein